MPRDMLLVAAGAWAASRGCEIAGPGIEFYYSGASTPPESLRTEVCFVVEKAADR